MLTCYYAVIERHADLVRYRADQSTEGPWGPGLQHGGPPNALAVASAEAAVRAATGRDDLIALRLSSDFVGPVPVGDLEVRTTVVRAARSAVLANVVIASGGRDCLHVRVWFVRDADTADLDTDADGAPGSVPDGLPSLDTDFPYGASLEWRLVEGGMRRLGPAAAWVRPKTPLVADYDYSALARAVLVADSASGLGAELDWTDWSFLNVDLDVHLARPLRGEWLLIHGSMQVGPHGSALARSTLSDVHGLAGGGMQTLVVSRRRT